MTADVPDAARLPQHLITLHGEDWAAWRWVALRATGFPAAMILALASPAGTAAADRLLAAWKQHDEVCERVLAAVRAALDDLKQRGQWDDKPRRKTLLKALQALKKGKAPKGLDEMAEMAELAAARERLAAERAAYEQAYEAATLHQAEGLHEVALDRRFQEAVLWQNRAAFHTAVRKVAETPPAAAGRNAQRRQHEELVAMYLQRYTVKNDTIGFFGPVGWARLVDEGEPMTARPGPELIAQRNVYLESWGVQELALFLGRLKEVRPWLKPQRLPYARLSGTTLHLPTADPVQLDPAQTAVLSACDGQRTARQIAQLLVADPQVAFAGEAPVYEQLARFRDQKVIGWDFQVPVRPNAEGVFEEEIRQLGDARTRKVCAAALREFERARQHIAAAGDVEKLDGALGYLNKIFSHLTRSSATRLPGETYAARTLVYEDCRRDLEMTLGPQIRHGIGEPLSLLLQSLRWCTFGVARAFRELARQIHAELDRGDGAPVEALPFWMRIEPLISGEADRTSGPVFAELRRRWIEILGVDPRQRRVELSVDDLRQRVERAFAAPHPGWQQALYHTPDLLIAASGLEALARGEYQVVVGEIHAAFNTLSCWLFDLQHPEPGTVLRDVAADLSEPSLKIAGVKEEIGASRLFWLPPPENVRMVPPFDHVLDIPESQEVAVADLVVVERGEGIFLESRDGSLSIDVAEAMGPLLSNKVGHIFDIAGGHTHWPRITIDRLVISRETWVFDAGELRFATLKDPAQRFLEARRWAARLGLPRFLFIGVDLEQKPFYVDLDVPFCVEHLARQIRRVLDTDDADRAVKVSEMLPTPEQLWVPDAQGNRYTGELRMVVVDRSRETLRQTRG